MDQYYAPATWYIWMRRKSKVSVLKAGRWYPVSSRLAIFPRLLYVGHGRVARRTNPAWDLFLLCLASCVGSEMQGMPS